MIEIVTMVVIGYNFIVFFFFQLVEHDVFYDGFMQNWYMCRLQLCWIVIEI